MTQKIVETGVSRVAVKDGVAEHSRDADGVVLHSADGAAKPKRSKVAKAVAAVKKPAKRKAG